MYTFVKGLLGVIFMYTFVQGLLAVILVHFYEGTLALIHVLL